MTNNIAIKVENLGKRYRMGQYVGSGAQYKTLRESLTTAVSAPLRRLRHSRSPILTNITNQTNQTNQPNPSNQTNNDRFMWALKDVSFEVKRGEVLGIIGRNGAGKSTLLKILTRITEPTTGRVEMHGRVGSLLEVGTGFHPELTGRENVYLSGAILGMSRKEIDRKFDEIVDFSGVEKYIDTPVKRYSSGMSVRLGFAVAAHLEPEILLVDEVLAVGDAAFQKKCLGKMGEVAGEGRTVVFVSHNMGAITNLCPRAILLNDGEKIADGVASTVVEGYVASVSDATGSSYVCQERPNGRAWIVSANLKSEDGQNSGSFLMSEPIIVECALNIVEKTQLTLSVQIKEMNNSPIYHFPNGDSSYVLPTLPGSYRIKVRIPPLNLYPGKYLLQLSLGRSGVYDVLHIVDSISFRVQQDYLLCARPLGRHAGVVFSHAEWSTASSDQYK